MATIRDSCQACGEVEFTSDDIQVKIENNDGSGSYIFVCPECQKVVIKPASSKTIDLLMASGVEQVDIPLEFLEPKSGLPVSYDDLIDFHNLLEDLPSDWYEELEPHHTE